jgi:hypothetical protein
MRSHGKRRAQSKFASLVHHYTLESSRAVLFLDAYAE